MLNVKIHNIRSRNVMEKLSYNLLVLYVCMVTGCASSLKLIPSDWGISDSNVPLEASGRAANILSDQVSLNISTSASRMADMQAANGWLYAFLVLSCVVGIVFWFLTKSRFGWIIPVASIIGLGLITAMARYGEWIGLGVLVIGLGLLAWKAIEYQRERNRLSVDAQLIPKQTI